MWLYNEIRNSNHQKWLPHTNVYNNNGTYLIMSLLVFVKTIRNGQQRRNGGTFGENFYDIIPYVYQEMNITHNI